MIPRPSFFSADRGAGSGSGVQASALPSLLDGPQPDFFATLDAETQESIKRRERAGEYTADRLFSQKPELYREVVRLLGDGIGLKSIGRRLGVSPNTVRAVRNREGAAVDTRRGKTVEALQDFVLEAAERFRDEGADIPINQLAVPFGVAVEKMQLLSGGATQRVEVVEVSPIDDWNSYVESLPSANVTPMGLEAEALEQKSDGQQAPAAAGSAANVEHGATVEQPASQITPDARRDLESGISGHSSGSITQPATHFATHAALSDLATDPATDLAQAGGEGVDSRAHPPASGVGLPETGPGTKEGNSDPFERLQQMTPAEVAEFANGSGPSTSEALQKNGGAAVGLAGTAGLLGTPSAPPPSEKKEGGRICGFCGGHAQGLHFTDSQGNGEGEEVALCNECGGPDGPAMSVIWEKLRAVDAARREQQWRITHGLTAAEILAEATPKTYGT